MKTKTKQITFLAIALVGWTVLLAFQVGATFDFVGSALLGLVFFASLLGFVVAVIVGIFTRRWRFTRDFGVALFVIFTSSLAARFVSEHQRRASIAAAQPIIAAAEGFHSATGSYPQSLGDLIPSHLPTEPRTKMGFDGTAFRFSANPDGFRITFELPVWMLCSYDSESKQWMVHD